MLFSWFTTKIISESPSQFSKWPSQPEWSTSRQKTTKCNIEIKEERVSYLEGVEQCNINGFRIATQSDINVAGQDEKPCKTGNWQNAKYWIENDNKLSNIISVEGCFNNLVLENAVPKQEIIRLTLRDCYRRCTDTLKDSIIFAYKNDTGETNCICNLNTTDVNTPLKVRNSLECINLQQSLWWKYKVHKDMFSAGNETCKTISCSRRDLANPFLKNILCGINSLLSTKMTPPSTSLSSRSEQSENNSSHTTMSIRPSKSSSKGSNIVASPGSTLPIDATKQVAFTFLLQNTSTYNSTPEKRLSTIITSYTKDPNKRDIFRSTHTYMSDPSVKKTSAVAGNCCFRTVASTSRQREDAFQCVNIRIHDHDSDRVDDSQEGLGQKPISSTSSDKTLDKRTEYVSADKFDAFMERHDNQLSLITASLQSLSEGFSYYEEEVRL
ncbi:unnamed protein product [Mytilus coruscus]|uniref:Uncharacterized protein n=1 Tax=Mytilus coruscus TaxID=42192 RepID=A0A6J8DPP6_MYTCO|nr:unnamed protein product [Mytilus coruscus]